MKITEAINQLEDLIGDRRAFISGDEELDKILVKDIEALKYAVDVLRGSLAEMPAERSTMPL